jgi:hypothetical protein
MLCPPLDVYRTLGWWQMMQELEGIGVFVRLFILY